MPEALWGVRLGQNLVHHCRINCLHTARRVGHGSRRQIPIEVGKPGVVAKFDQVEVESGSACHLLDHATTCTTEVDR